MDEERKDKGVVYTPASDETPDERSSKLDVEVSFSDDSAALPGMGDSSEAGRRSNSRGAFDASDSLDMNSADFEMGTYQKRAQERRACRYPELPCTQGGSCNRRGVARTAPGGTRSARTRPPRRPPAPAVAR